MESYGVCVTGAGTRQILCRCPREQFSRWSAPKAQQALSVQAEQPQPAGTHSAAWCWGQCRQTKGVGWKGSTAWVCETLELLDSHQRKKCNQAQSHTAWAHNCLPTFLLIAGRALLPGALELPALPEQPSTSPRTANWSPGQDDAIERTHPPLPLTTVPPRSSASSSTPLCSASLPTCLAQLPSLFFSSSFPADALPAGYPETHCAPPGHRWPGPAPAAQELLPT